MAKINLQEIRKIVDEYLNAQDIIGRKRDGYYFHLKRFKKIIELLKLCPEFKGKILDVGHYDALIEIIRRAFPGNEYLNTDTELRDDLPFADNSFDFVLNCEVIEHIAEKDLHKIQAFHYSRILNLLKENHRVLKPKGVLFLTTPNACSFLNITKALQNQNPMTYFLHYKEFTVWQVINFINDLNFDIEWVKTEYVFTNKEDHKDLEDFARAKGFKIDGRGDMTVVKAVKKV